MCSGSKMFRKSSTFWQHEKKFPNVRFCQEGLEKNGRTTTIFREILCLSETHASFRISCSQLPDFFKVLSIWTPRPQLIATLRPPVHHSTTALRCLSLGQLYDSSWLYSSAGSREDDSLQHCLGLISQYVYIYMVTFLYMIVQ